MDAGKYPFAAPVETWDGTSATPVTTSFGDRRAFNENDGWVNHHTYAYFHPERGYAFLKSVVGLPTGASVDDPQWLWSASGDSLQAFRPGPGPEPSDGSGAMVGRWGADRNGNRRLDRGPLPGSVRLRATSVARYLVYDPRLLFVLR